MVKKRKNQIKKNRLGHSDQWDQSLRTLPRNFPRLVAFLRAKMKTEDFSREERKLVKEVSDYYYLAGF